MRSVMKAANEGKLVLTLGGDHALGAGTVAGVLASRPETGIIWVVSHKPHIPHLTTHTP